MARSLRPEVKLVQIWVPDTRSAAFAAEARRQSAMVELSPYEATDQAFIEAVSDSDR